MLGPLTDAPGAVAHVHERSQGVGSETEHDAGAERALR